MTEEQRAMVRKSWALVREADNCVISSFYEVFFELRPELRRLFASEMRVQAKMLRAALSLVVESMDADDGELSCIAMLGRRHAEWGVTAQHLELGGQALLVALSDCLGARWTPELCAAWMLAYSRILAAMFAGSRGHFASVR